MAVIVPFRGLRYNPGLVTELADVITPPYDMITATEQERLYRRSPYNMIRLEYGKSLPGDDAANNRYTRAAASFNRWLQEEALIAEDEPSFYLYRQSFALREQLFHRNGLVAALKLEPYSGKTILPHEDTLASPKKDRLELLRRCRANFSPIFGLFADPERRFAEICSRAQQGSPLFEFADREGQRHALWKVAGAQEQAELAELIAPKQIFIADGHHRYETALQFSQESGPRGGRGSGYVLAVLVPLEDPGLVILPFHRLLSGLGAAQRELLFEIIDKHFHFSRCGPLEELNLAAFVGEMAARGRQQPAMGLLLPEGSMLLWFKEKRNAGELDVSILKRLFLDPLLEGSGDPEKHLDFTNSEEEARQAVLEGRAQAAFLLNPTPIEAVAARALRGENMPQKSTCFYPKLPSGLVIHHLELSHRED
ncbi:MAG: DUF1015 domain-containing protein [Firmicutes bacterium]|mgnify:CR=1 FL=1|jgi:uncharacterized protein (DUF1015 family)|nr:DUF1015 domain-containing protein [Bacillota bacterium]HPU01659.1 DUF1015 domain-containing protein [Bacillota bacterium]